MDETTRYDLIVIGSGPAGEKGAAQAALLGKKVALIERGQHLGGAAANTVRCPRRHCVRRRLRSPPSASVWLVYSDEHATLPVIR